MEYPFLILLLLVMYLDLELFRRNNKDLFHQIFHLPKKVFLIISVCIIIVLLAAPEGREVLPLFFFIFVLPLYLLRRFRYLKGYFVKCDDADSQSPGPFALLSDGYGVILYWFFSLFVVTFVIKLVMKIWPAIDSKLTELLISTVCASIVALVLIDRVTRKFSSKGFLSNVGFTNPNQSIFKVIFLPSLLGLFFAYMSALIIILRKVQPHTPLNDVLSSVTSPLVILAFLFIAIFLAPITEEIIFRGYFYQVLKKVKGNLFSICVVSLGFALLHVGQYWGDALAILMVTVLSFALTSVRAWTKTTTSSTIMHFFYNGGVTIIPVILMLSSNPAYFKYKAYYHKIDTEEKIEYLYEAIKKQPDLADAYNDLAWIYAEEEKSLNEALGFIEKALSYSPNDYNYLDTKAEVLFKLGRYGESIALRDVLIPRDSTDYQLKRKMEAMKEKETYEEKWSGL